MKQPEKLTNTNINLLSRNLFTVNGTLLTLDQAIVSDADVKATQIVLDLNRTIALSPHRHCQ